MSKGESKGEPTKDKPPNILINSKCSACSRDSIDPKETIQCSDCKSMVHGVNCLDNYNVCAISYFGTIRNAVMKVAGFKNTFGNISFTCDTCQTVKETNAVLSAQDKVSLLESKMNSQMGQMKDQIDEMKHLIVDGFDGVRSRHVSGQSDVGDFSPVKNSTLNNPWVDTVRSEQMRQTFVINKDTDGSINRNEIEKICVDNNVCVTKTFSISGSNKLGVVLPSAKDAKKFKESVAGSSSGSDYKINKLSTKNPRITLVGLEHQYDKKELAETLISQNETIGAVFSDSSGSADDKLLEVVAVIPLRNDPNIFRAVIKVSNVIRTLIHKLGDRLYAGLTSRCRVYDNLFVLRCYHCQAFGHHSTNCPDQSRSATCGYCAGLHMTKNCHRKSDVNAMCCINCKNADADNVMHYANSLSCPQLVNAQRKLTAQIPFYRLQNLAKGQAQKS